MSQRIYLDSCIVIYLVEKNPLFAEKITARIEQTLSDEKVLAVSPLVKLEVLAKPLRDKDTNLIQTFENFLATLEFLSIPDSVYETALQLRANYHLKVPDALHLAIAQHHNCVDFWTNDNRLEIAAKQLNIQSFMPEA